MSQVAFPSTKTIGLQENRPGRAVGVIDQMLTHGRVAVPKRERHGRVLCEQFQQGTVPVPISERPGRRRDYPR